MAENGKVPPPLLTYGTKNELLQYGYQWTPNGLKRAPKHVLEEDFFPKHLVKFSLFIDYIDFEWERLFGLQLRGRGVLQTWKRDPSAIIGPS